MENGTFEKRIKNYYYFVNNKAETKYYYQTSKEKKYKYISKSIIEIFKREMMLTREIKLCKMGIEKTEKNI